jgi:hypothetical protein
MLNGIGDLEAALKLVGKMRVEAAATIDSFRRLVNNLESVSPKFREGMKPSIAVMETSLAKASAGPTTNADLLTQLDEVCAVSQFQNLRAILDRTYELLSGTIVDSEKTKEFRALSERVTKIRMALRAIDELRSAGVPSELLNLVSQSLKPEAADKMDAYVQAQIVLNEPGHLGERLAKFLGLMEKSALSSFNEQQKQRLEQHLALVDSFYDFLSHMELLREFQELLAETVQIERLRALQAQAHGIEDMHKKLIAAGDLSDIEARLVDFMAVAKLPEKA